jgi:NADPH-dependent glutamate synthase beta subunit-like oxidoreductase/NAD(P)H-flavin reductase
MTEPLPLALGFHFADLYDETALPRLDAAFLARLTADDPSLAERLRAARAAPETTTAAEESDLLLSLAPYVDAFLAHLFGIEADVGACARRHRDLDPLYACKRLFVQRRALKQISAAEAAAIDGEALYGAVSNLLGGSFDQQHFAERVMAWLDDEAGNAAALDLAARYAAWAVHTEAGRQRHRNDRLFRVPAKLDVSDLVGVPAQPENGIAVRRLAAEHQHARDGFALTDGGTDLTGALDEAHYCILCHHQGRDSCSKGLRDKKTGAFAVNPLGVTVPGCPLAEKISEMHEAKRAGHLLAALAVITVDNPMVAATGHRICNDCMKACIYQKQEPVNIPEAETRILKDVLSLPWGFEIYSLLTRWNPLNIRRPLPAAESGYKVLIVGLGPAGFSLAHHLMNQGHTVVAIDGAKIEPLPPHLSGVDAFGRRTTFVPVRDVKTVFDDLDDRIMAGFGGVAEYGITVRWDKNFLKIIRLLVERRRRLALVGGVRFGGALTTEQAFAMGFDHIALCLGAGKPTLLGIPNELARGVRQASDFLMALQLTGAAKFDSIANLQIRMPIVVIGGGLTAIDTATEALAYYVRQVEKFKSRYDRLVAAHGRAAVEADWTAEDREIAAEFLAHAEAISAERGRAAGEGRLAQFTPLLDRWGGSTVAYRRRMIESPSYTLNHEEIVKALEQGARFAEQLVPQAIEVDAFGHVRAVRFRHPGQGAAADEPGEVVLPARTLLVAAGTQPNTVLAREWPDFAQLDGKYFQAIDEDGNPVTPERSAKPAAAHVLMQMRGDGRALSFFGDLHPSYAGNVVKALASAKQGFPVVDRCLRRRPPAPVAAAKLADSLNQRLRPVVRAVRRLTPTAVEITVEAPLAAAAYRAGQFFRLQNFEARATRVGDTTLAMEAVALTGARIDRDNGSITLIALDMGGSTSIVPLLQPGEPLVLMGPTGAASHIPPGETVLLAGGGVGTAELLTTKAAIRQAGGRVLFFAGYRRIADCFLPDAIEADADAVIWCCEETPGIAPRRPQDRSVVGNVVEAMQAYAEGRLGDGIPLHDVDRILVVGSDRMMAAIAAARHARLKPYLRPDHVALASINSPMQCMMKEICAQCLQPQQDPATGERSVVFSCFCQDQPLDRVDFAALHERLAQNRLQENLTRQWIAFCKRRLAEKKSAAENRGLVQAALPPAASTDWR